MMLSLVEKLKDSQDSNLCTQTIAYAMPICILLIILNNNKKKYKTRIKSSVFTSWLRLVENLHE